MADVPGIPQLDIRRPLTPVTASRNLAIADSQRHLHNSGTSALTLTIPQNTFEAGDEIEIACPGTGTFSLTPGSGVALNGGTAALPIVGGQTAILKFYSPNLAYLFRSHIPTTSGSGLIYGNNTLITVDTLAANPTMLSFNLPGGTVAPNGMLVFSWIHQGTAGVANRTFNIRIGGVSVASFPQTTTNRSTGVKYVYNRGGNTLVSLAPNGLIPVANSTANIQAAALDWTVNQTVDAQAILTADGNGISLLAFNVSVFNP